MLVGKHVLYGILNMSGGGVLVYDFKMSNRHQTMYELGSNKPENYFSQSQLRVQEAFYNVKTRSHWIVMSI